MLFVYYATKILGQDIELWRARQEAIWLKIVDALDPLYQECNKRRRPDARAVAEAKNPAVMAYLTAVLRWPDRSQAARYVQGFDLVGHHESTGIFRQLGQPATVHSPEDMLTSAEQRTCSLLRSKPPLHHEKILELTQGGRRGLYRPAMQHRRHRYEVRQGALELHTPIPCATALWEGPPHRQWRKRRAQRSLEL